MAPVIEMSTLLLNLNSDKKAERNKNSIPIQTLFKVLYTFALLGEILLKFKHIEPLFS